ncbi:hypothetical protein GCM10027190_55430 [Spirosoma areae]
MLDKPAKMCVYFSVSSDIGNAPVRQFGLSFEASADSLTAPQGRRWFVRLLGGDRENAPVDGLTKAD